MRASVSAMLVLAACSSTSTGHHKIELTVSGSSYEPDETLSGCRYDTSIDQLIVVAAGFKGGPCDGLNGISFSVEGVSGTGQFTISGPLGSTHNSIHCASSAGFEFEPTQQSTTGATISIDTFPAIAAGAPTMLSPTNTITGSATFSLVEVSPSVNPSNTLTGTETFDCGTAILGL
jgi:hypothetical protein